jgi:periplasmic copper chaperone A
MWHNAATQAQMESSMRRFAWLALLLATAAATAQSDPLQLGDAWLREPPPGQTTAAIYMSLRNEGNEQRELSGARVDGASSAAIHEHRHADGMMQMRQVDRVVVEPGASLRFEPGGYHLMVFGLAQRPRGGDVLPFCLLFADGTEQCGEARVRSLGE